MASKEHGVISVGGLGGVVGAAGPRVDEAAEPEISAPDVDDDDRTPCTCMYVCMYM